MNCQKVLKVIPLYISDDLDGPDLTAVEDHLGGCLNCYREYQSYLKALRDLKRLGEKPNLNDVMAGFSDEVMARIAHDEGGPAAPVPRVTYAFVPRMIAAAAVLLLVLTGFYLFQNSADTPPVDEPNPSPDVVQPSIPVISDYYPWAFPEREEMLDPKKRKAWMDDPNLNHSSPYYPRVQPVRFRRDF